MMTPQELILLDTLGTHIPADIQKKTDISILTIGVFTDQFIDTVTNLLHSADSTVYNTPSEDRKYDLVLLSSHSSSFSQEEIKAYKKLLLSNGIVAFCANSKSLIQRPSEGQLADIKSSRQLSQLGLQVLFFEAAGKLEFIHAETTLKSILSIAKKLPNSRIYSPFFVVVLQKVEVTSSIRHYKSLNSLPSRLGRIFNRISYAAQNHKINDYLVSIRAAWEDIIKSIKTVLLMHRAAYNTRVLPRIPLLQKHKKHSLIIVMTYLQTGGVERVILNLLKGLDRSIFDIHLVTTVESSHEWHSVFEPYVDSITHVASIIDKSWPIKYRQRYLSDLIIKSQPNTIFITNSEAAYHALPKVAKHSPDTHIYDLLHTHGTPRDNDAYLRISMPYDRYISRRIVISEYLKSYYYNKYPVDPKKIDVIYNSLDSDTLAFMATKLREEPLFTAIPKEQRVITFIGRLEFDKSPQRLVTIARKLKELSLNGHIVVIGDGTLRGGMEHQAEAEGTLGSYISFYGLSNDPLKQMAQSDFTILVSNAEGIPMSVLESMSVGVPAISSSVGGVPEIITHYKDGLLVDISEDDEDMKIEAFVSEINSALELSNTQYISMTKAARQTIDNRFSSMNKYYQSLFLYGTTTSEDKAARE